MKKTTYLVLPGVMLLALVAGTAFAHEDEQENERPKPFGQTVSALAQERNTLKAEGKELAKIELKVNGDQPSAVMHPNGDFRLTGVTVNSVDTSANTITGTLYGVTRTVSAAGASLWGGGKSITLSDIKAGDKIVVVGSYSADTHSLTIREVRDVTYSQQAVSGVQKQIEELRRKLQELQEQLKGLLH